MRRGVTSALIVSLVVGCSKPAPERVIGTTDHCEFAEPVAVANTGGTVTAAPLQAGAAEVIATIPVGTALGSYTGRASFTGDAVAIDNRKIPISGPFSPSVGIETAPKVKALALSAGDETVLILKVDLGYTFEGHTFELEDRLGPEYAGKILITASHSHSAWGQYSGHQAIGTIGSGPIRRLVYDALMDAYEDAARAALANLQSAQIGVHVETDFDPTDQINRDRRGENDVLSGGESRDDNHLYVIRVESTTGAPIAMVPIFGMHGTLQDYDNPFASTDAIGGLERALEEQFDTPVVVMHVQGSIGDVSPVGHGGVDCTNAPGDPADPCFTWLVNEGHGRVAWPAIWSGWVAAGASMRDTIELEAVSRSVRLGPDRRTFTVRDGVLQYRPFDAVRKADGVVYDGADIASPIDEFNAPVGAALCGDEDPLIHSATMPGTSNTLAYRSCVRVDVAAELLGAVMGVPFETAEDQPVCQSTRTTVSAVRIGEFVIAGMPGEVTTYYGDALRASSPVPADNTVVVSFVNGHVGYLLTAEDWLLGGYEPSINFWGPLEAEYLAERASDVLAMVNTPEREDARVGGANRVVPSFAGDSTFVPEPAPLAGTIPAAVPTDVWSRTGPIGAAQPEAVIERITGIARFTWIGEDPLAETPVVTLQQETAPGVFEDVVRRSTRVVRDRDLVIAHTPIPLYPADPPRTHYWVVEWQAVGWTGDITDYRSLPVGSYRFHVTGDSYEIFSDAFDVVPTTLQLNAVRSGSEITLSTTAHAATGYRLLALTGASNQPVPVADAAVDVTLTLNDMSTMSFTGLTTGPDGTLTVDAGGQAPNVASATITDTFNNSGTTSVP